MKTVRRQDADNVGPVHLPTFRCSKKAGITPMAYAAASRPHISRSTSSTRSLNHYAPAKTSNDFVFHNGKSPTIDIPGYVKAATTFQNWSKEGYLSHRGTGTVRYAGPEQFDGGKAGFFIEGDWYI